MNAIPTLWNLWILTWKAYAFDGLSTCLFSEVFVFWLSSFDMTLFPLITIIPASGGHWASVLESVLRLECLCSADRQRFELTFRESISKWDRIAELNNGCMNRLFSGVSRRDIRQTGQVECCWNHMSIHVAWKECPHIGKIRSASCLWYSARQTMHLWQ